MSGASRWLDANIVAPPSINARTTEMPRPAPARVNFPCDIVKTLWIFCDCVRFPYDRTSHIYEGQRSLDCKASCQGGERKRRTPPAPLAKMRPGLAHAAG